MFRILVEKSERKRPLGRLRPRCENNIKMDLQEIGCVVMYWMELAQDKNRCRALVNAVMDFRVSSNSGNFWTNCKPVSFPRRTLLRGVCK
jgi:hypothetical protein